MADNAWLVPDTQQYKAGHGRREIAQGRQRPLLGDPGDAGNHQREADCKPAFVEGEGQRQRQ